MRRAITPVLTTFVLSVSSVGAAAQPLVEDLCVERVFPVLDNASLPSSSSIAIAGDTLILSGEFFFDLGPNFDQNILICVPPTAFDIATQTKLFDYVPDTPMQPTQAYGLDIAESGGVLAVPWFDFVVGGQFTTGAVVLFDTATGVQLSLLTPAGLDDGDLFGGSIDLIGSTLVVGAPGDDSVPGDNAGAVYVFDISDPANPVQLHKLTPSDPTRTFEMGRSVATDGTTIITGTNSDDTGAYLFDLETGAQQAAIPAVTVNGSTIFYGDDVAVDGDLAVVGAFGDGLGPIDGQAYIYTIADRQHPVNIATLTGDISFGTELVLQGNRLVIGARFATGFFGRFEVYDLCNPASPVLVGFGNNAASCIMNDTVAFGQGLALAGNTLAVRGFYTGAVYTLDPLPACTTETLIATDKLLADAGEPVSLLGASAALDGDLAILGAPNDGSTTSTGGAGAVYLFDTNTQQQVGKLMADDAALEAEFGRAVAAQGGILAAGAPADSGAGDSAGAVYLFDTATQTQTDKLVPAGLQPFSNFGVSVAVDGNTLIAGADAPGFFNTLPGAVYVFDATTGQEIRTLVPTSSAPRDRFGNAVAIDGNIAIIGAIGFQTFPTSDPGKAYLFDISTGQQLHELVPSISLNGDRFGSAVAINNGYALVTALHNSILATETVYVFDVATGQLIGELADPEAEPLSPEGFGTSVAIAGDTAVVGFPGGTGIDGETGVAQLFDLSTFELTARLLPANSVTSSLFPPNELGARFGSSLATDGARLLIGAENDGESRDLGGAGYLYDFTDDPSPCPADVNGDGQLTPGDFNGWILAFNTQAPACDQNGDGACTPADFNGWIINYNAGCP